MSVVMNGPQFISGLDDSWERFEKKFGLRMKNLMVVGMDRLLKRTPVWTGRAAASYRASSGAPSSSAPAAGGPVVEPTNELALGVERNRPAAEARSRSSLSSVRADDPFTTYWIVNRSPNISGLEHGELPQEPYRSRSPGGMFAITLQELSALLGSGVL